MCVSRSPATSTRSMANDPGTLRTPHRRWYISICTGLPIFGTGFPGPACIPARKPFVAVSAVPRHSSSSSSSQSSRRGCAHLARTTFFSSSPCLRRAAAYRCGWRFFAFYFPGRLRASLLEPRNDLCDQLDSSFSLAPRHNSYPNCRLSSFPPAARSPGSSSIRSAGSLSPPDVASSLMVVVLFVVFPPGPAASFPSLWTSIMRANASTGRTSSGTLAFLRFYDFFFVKRKWITKFH